MVYFNWLLIQIYANDADTQVLLLKTKNLTITSST